MTVRDHETNEDFGTTLPSQITLMIRYMYILNNLRALDKCLLCLCGNMTAHMSVLNMI